MKLPAVIDTNRLLWYAWFVFVAAAALAFSLQHLGIRSLTFPLFLIGALVYGAARVYVRWQSLGISERGIAIQAYAAEHGYSFEETADPLQAMDLFHSLNEFPLFRNYAKSQTGSLTPAQHPFVIAGYRFFGILPMTHVVRGEISGRPFVAFDYFTRDGNSKHSNATHLTTLMIHHKGLDLPPFRLRERKDGLVGFALSAIGWGGIDVPGVPGFDGTFKLTGKAKDSLRDIFRNGPGAYFYEHQQEYRGCIVEGRGNDLLLYKEKALVPPESYDTFLRLGLDAAKAFSPHR